MIEHIKKDKSVIIIVFLSLLLIGVSAFFVYNKLFASNNVSDPESKKESDEENGCVTDKSMRKYCITANLYTNDQEHSELNEKIKFSFTLPDGYYLEDDYLEGDAIVDAKGNKVGINPCHPVKLGDGEKMPTDISELNDQDEEWISSIYDSEYYTQNDLQIFLTHSKEAISGYTEGAWSQLRYLRRFWINKGDIVFEMVFFTTKKNLVKEELDSLKQSAESFIIYE